MKPIILVVGTRAEAIKLIPLFLELKKEKINALLCGTFQHSEMLNQVCKIFDVIPDFNLNVMKQGQDLFYLNTVILEKTKEVYLKTDPTIVLVHGDTTTTMAAAMSAFYLHIPIGHVEAGLRTGNMQSPFPEEMNRKVVGQIADYHFAPTAFSTANLLAEGVKRERVFCTGNTIVDALYWMKEKIEKNQMKIEEEIKKFVQDCKNNNKKIILLTAHRRESFNGGLSRIFEAIKQFAKEHEDICIFFPVHPNPNVLAVVKESGIEDIKNIFTSKPVSHKELIYLLLNTNFVATDSGGIQEEAVSLGKKVLVLRDVTERWEGVWDGSEKLVGTNTDLILTGLNEFYNLDKNANIESSIYGDGNACKRIVNILKSKFSL
ncbi:UDP-N-acetylglucosamine 2-epimerase (non-hydrolyzing) [Candidatus Babeliales bacterium]|nr:UDP-N-acetylglucosamine 2-epimerase (non-hydrolyzing) [Candidatus Babeliales bacterium]MCF7899792.1 UDP-N-acetylglucosamine 2-epimerase (non-hydrolyzing) [Candidatus Babeliales bacterium]